MLISNYKFGAMTVNGVRHSEDLIIYPDRIEAGWFRERGHSLSIDDLKGVMDFKPDYLIVGRGAYGRMVIPPETRSFLKKNNVELLSGGTEDMCELFNHHMEEGKRTVGAFHLTC